MKKKWEDLTKLSPPVSGQSVPASCGSLYPKYPRMRVWRTEREFNGLRLPKTWRWKTVTCHCCGHVGREKEYASWGWRVPKTDYEKSVNQAIESMRPILEEAFDAKGGFWAARERMDSR